MDTFGERLRQERLRLGKNQVDFGEIAGVQKQAQIKYEKDERKPDSAYLQAIAAAGVDVRYVVTGERASPQELELERRLRLVKKTTTTAVSIPGLNKEQQAKVQAELFKAELAQLLDHEQALLVDYRKCTEEQQALVRSTTANFAAAAKPSRKSKN